MHVLRQFAKRVHCVDTYMLCTFQALKNLIAYKYDKPQRNVLRPCCSKYLIWHSKIVQQCMEQILRHNWNKQKATGIKPFRSKRWFRTCKLRYHKVVKHVLQLYLNTIMETFHNMHNAHRQLIREGKCYVVENMYR